MKKNILVFGGSYFVGRIFVEDLIREGVYSVYVVNRGNRPIKIEGIHEIVCNRNHPEHLRASLPPLVWDAVVDFCAYSPVDIEQSMSALPQAALRHYIFIGPPRYMSQRWIFPFTKMLPS